MNTNTLIYVIIIFLIFSTMFVKRNDYHKDVITIEDQIYKNERRLDVIERKMRD